MSWLSAAPAFLTAAGLLLVPGLLISWILRLRGLWLWAFAGPASLSVVVVASVLAPLVGIPWSVVAIVAGTGVLATIAVLLRLTVLRRDSSRQGTPLDRRLWLSVGGLAVGGIAIAIQLVIIVAAPENISQTFDNVFHLNAVRFILDTADASPFSVGRMTGDAVWFYPAAWHGVVAMVSQLSGAAIPIASNAVLFVIAAVVWPATVVLLTRVLTGGSRWVEAIAGLIAAAIPAFPFLLADYGVLYPYLLGVAVLPAAVAATIAAFGLQDAPIGRAAAAIVLLGSMPGLAFAHPGAFVAWMAAAIVCGSCAYIFFVRGTPPVRPRVLAGVALGLGVLFAIAAVIVLRPAVEARGWTPVGSMGQAAGEVLFLSPHYPAVPMLVAVLLWFGLFEMVRRRTRTDVVALALFGAFAALYIVAQALPVLFLRDLITGSWYNDATRLAALLPMAAIPGAGLGTLRALSFVTSVWGRKRWTARTAVLIVLAVVVGLQAHSTVVLIRWAQPTYEYAADSPLISADELALLERLSLEVGEDDVIAGNPWTGTSLAYAFADRRVLMPHILMDETEDDETINNALRDAAPDSAVCDALDREGVTYVLDFGSTEVHSGRHELRGLERLSASGAVTLVDREGDARLYKIIGCEESL